MPLSDLPAERVRGEVENATDVRHSRVFYPVVALLTEDFMVSRQTDLDALRFDLPFDPPTRELAILATVRELKCEFEWAAHVAEGRKVGVREEAIDAVRAGTAPAGLTPDEAQVVNYVHLIVRQHRVDDATFEAMKARFGERGLVELTSLIGYYNLVSTVMDAFGVEPPPNTDRMPL